MILFVFDDLLEDVDAGLVVELANLRAILGDVAALFDLEAAEGEVGASNLEGEGIGLAGLTALVDGLRSAEVGDARLPKGGVVRLGCGEVLEDLAAGRVGLLLREGAVGEEAGHLSLPVLFQCVQKFTIGWTRICRNRVRTQGLSLQR